MFRQLFLNADNKDAIGNRFRNKRFNFFRQHLQQFQSPIKILDVGGTETFWIHRGLANDPDIQLTLLNLEKHDVVSNNIKTVKGTAVSMDMFSDCEFDIVFSNSVIEHLYTWENQQRMASEVKRVGKKFFVQTPNKYFPVEPHYVLPLFQYVPAKPKYFILTKTKLSLLKKWDPVFARQCIDEIRLLSTKEMKKLFPNENIYLEKFFGLTKSITAHNFNNE